MDTSSDLDDVYFDCDGDEVPALSSPNWDDDSEAEDDEEVPRLNARSRVDDTKTACSSSNSRPRDTDTTTITLVSRRRNEVLAYNLLVLST